MQLNKFENLYRLERTLGRLRRAVEQLEYDEPADDLELAEVHLFRPLFRYRAEVSRQVKNQQRRQF
ncbi:GH20031 [Drosophila grimshawi]|uniref:GH20031 n=1 Tax=Drosophila grimshawi TaxID=7222 RepID=B4J7Q0_DROGR|nr:GH20031 [Drosophila grimshawi]